MPFLADIDLEYDPDGKKEQVAVVVRGSVYRAAGLKNSSHSEVEGKLYDNLCSLSRYKLRDEVRRMASNIAIAVQDSEFRPTIRWLDDFMKRFCFSRKKIGINVYSSAKLVKVQNTDVFPFMKKTKDCIESTSDLQEGISVSDLINDALRTWPKSEVGKDKEEYLKSSHSDMEDKPKEDNQSDSSPKPKHLKDEKQCLALKTTNKLKSASNCFKKVTVSSDSAEDAKSDNSSDESSDSTVTESNESNNDEAVKKSWEAKNVVSYSTKEDKYYEDNTSVLQRHLEEKSIHCAACFCLINNAVRSHVYTHPLLGILVCKKCFHFYGTGSFKKDTEGYDEYCRCCANGGDLMLCDTCTNGFCKKCIKRNLGRTAEKEVMRARKWSCYVCNMTPLMELRALHRALLDSIRSKEAKDKISRFGRQKNIPREKSSDLNFMLSQRTVDKGDEDDWVAIFIDRMWRMVEIFGTRIRNIRRKYKVNDPEIDTVSVLRKLLKISKMMQNNFEKFDRALEEKSSLERISLKVDCSSKNEETTLIRGRQSSVEVDLHPKQEETSNEVSDEASDKASSKNPHGSDEDDGEKRPLNLSPIHMIVSHSEENALMQSTSEEIGSDSSSALKIHKRLAKQSNNLESIASENNVLLDSSCVTFEDFDASVIPMTICRSKHDNDLAKKSLIDSSDSEIDDSFPARKTIARKSTLRKGHRRKRKRAKDVIVKIMRLPRTVEEELKVRGYILESSIENMTQINSDEEFENIVRFNPTRKTGCCNEEDIESDSEAEDECEETLPEMRKRKVTRPERRKEEGLLDISLREDGEEEEDTVEDGKEIMSNYSMNEHLRKELLLSSDEENEGGSENSSNDEEEANVGNEDDKQTLDEIEEDRRKKYELRKKKDEEKKILKEKEENESDEDTLKTRRKYFSLKFLSDEDKSEEDKSDDTDNESPRKKRMFIESDSESDSRNSVKRKANIFKSSGDESSSSSDESLKESKKTKKQRKRIKRRASSSEDNEGEKELSNEESPTKKRIRKIIRDEDLLQTTKDATQEEKDRRDRVHERQQLYNKIFEIDVEKDQTSFDKVVLDFYEENKKELVRVDDRIVPFLKPHQVSGIKFMYDATIESLSRLQKNEKGGGAILAHCMGLGKTLQVIAFVHTLLSNGQLNNHIERVMVCCPVNTVYNWVHEFKYWLKGRLLHFEVIELISARDSYNRAYRLDDWYKEGGVCIIGYDMFRNLSNPENKRYKGNIKSIFQRTLVKPGPDVMVCDEGHILKNEKTALSKAVNRISTARRIVLTGTPLQNNLKEYHCMIQFVKPNLLGSKKEFMNRFVHPITTGQCIAAQPRDVRRMKRRAHILHNLLEGCVQRFDYSVLKPFLPPKYEYVISVQMCDVQCKLYEYYLQNLVQGGPKRSGSGLFVDFHNLSRVWSHPAVLYLCMRRKELEGYEEEEEDDLTDFIDDETESADSSDEDKKQKKKTDEDKEQQNQLREKPVGEDTQEINGTDELKGLTSSGKVKPDWWQPVLESIGGEEYDEDEFLNRVEISGKLFLLFDILRECCDIGDKVLLFSQSILVLDMIENFLKMMDDGSLDLFPETSSHFREWKRELDYVRLDGSTSPDHRKVFCEMFNSNDNERCRLFLISTRAGGLGINLIGANRVIIFDSSWNPSHDTQSIFRVYRFGQSKPCYVYRFVAQGTMEEKIYSRQVTKLSTALRVVDEHQIKRYFNMAELAELYEFQPADPEIRETPNVPEDRLLAESLIRNRKWIVGYHEHDSLLENQTEEELTEEERKAAWDDYETEKKNENLPRSYGPNLLSSNIPMFEIQSIIRSILAQKSDISNAELQENVRLATMQIHNAHFGLYKKYQGLLFNLKNPMIAPEIVRQLPYASPTEAVPFLERQLMLLEQNLKAENDVLKQLSKGNQLHSMFGGTVQGLASNSGTSFYYPSSTLAHVNTNFKKVTVPPYKSSKSSMAASRPDEDDRNTEVVMLE